MSVYRVKGVSVKALACAIPKQRFTLHEYAPDLVDENAAKKIGQVSGFRSLRIAPEGMTTADLAISSAELIISKIRNITLAGGGGNITALLFVSQTPDYFLPATSHILQSRLGLPNEILCLDINEGCSGFITGLYVAGLVAEKSGGYVLLMGGDTISKLTSSNDRASRTIFGDSGYATIIGPGGDDMPFMFSSYGGRADALITENSRHRIKDKPRNDGKLFMDGAALMKFTLSDVPKVITRFLEATGTTVDEVELFACHQANRLMLSSLARKLGVNDERLPFVAGNTGNTSSASIPLLLSEYAGKDCLSRVVCAGFGVGLSVGLCRANFSHTEIFNTIEI